MSDFKFDPNSTVNEGRWRLRDPNTVVNYRRWFSWDGYTVDGVGFVIGDDIHTGHKVVQAIRFNKGLWTEELAKRWWDEVGKDKFEKLWTEADWGSLEN